MCIIKLLEIEPQRPHFKRFLFSASCKFIIFEIFLFLMDNHDVFFQFSIFVHRLSQILLLLSFLWSWTHEMWFSKSFFYQCFSGKYNIWTTFFFHEQFPYVLLRCKWRITNITFEIFFASKWRSNQEWRSNTADRLCNPLNPFFQWI